jgi:hypothetical protein
MKAGFAKTDITPRVGVGLCGFGPFINRHSKGVRDRLWASAASIEANDNTVILIACDLIGVANNITVTARKIIQQATGVMPQNIMLNCSHTHSGPATTPMNGWGDPDYPYLEILPYKIADAAIKSFQAMEPGNLSYAEVPCEGIAVNRCHDKDGKATFEEIQDENWRPEMPEKTDTTCQVLKFEVDGQIKGFLSYFGCHPVVCCSACSYIHGDYPGIATNMLEREYPGSVGLFLQGAQGDINSSAVYYQEYEAMLALDVIASRYARAVRAGIKKASLVNVDNISAKLLRCDFSLKEIPLDQLLELRAEQEKVLHTASASDNNHEARIATVYLRSIRKLIVEREQNAKLAVETELQVMKIGNLTLIATPFETMREIKVDIVNRLNSDGPVMVTSLTNDYQGYAPDKEMAKESAHYGNYAANVVPFIFGVLPYANVHEELVTQSVELAKSL